MPLAAIVTVSCELVCSFRLADELFETIVKLDPSKLKLALPDEAVGMFIFPLLPAVIFPLLVIAPLEIVPPKVAAPDDREKFNKLCVTEPSLSDKPCAVKLLLSNVHLALFVPDVDEVSSKFNSGGFATKLISITPVLVNVDEPVLVIAPLEIVPILTSSLD